MQAILYLCQKSVALRIKQKKKAEQAEEDKDCEKGVIYDEDDEEGLNFDDIGEDDDEEEDEWDLDSNSDEDDNPELYEHKMDKIDEVLYVQEMLSKLQASNPQHYGNILGVLTQEEQTGLASFINQAQLDKNEKDVYAQQEMQAKLALQNQNVQQVDLNQLK